MDAEGNARAAQLIEPGDPEGSLTVREGAIIDAYGATFPELPDPAVIGAIEAQAAADPETREAKATDASEIGPKEEAGIAAIERDDAEPEAEVESRTRNWPSCSTRWTARPRSSARSEAWRSGIERAVPR